MVIILTFAGGIIGFISFLISLVLFDAGILMSFAIYVGAGLVTTLMLVGFLLVANSFNTANTSIAAKSDRGVIERANTHSVQ